MNLSIGLEGLFINLTNLYCVLERFLWWSVFSTVAPMTRAIFRTLGFEFSRAAWGLRARVDRHKACAANVNANYGLALSYLYVNKHFDEHEREKVRFILHALL